MTHIDIVVSVGVTPIRVGAIVRLRGALLLFAFAYLQVAVRLAEIETVVLIP